MLSNDYIRLLGYKGMRKLSPTESLEIVEKMISYLQKEAKKDRYPTCDDLEKNFRTNLKTHGLKIRDLYNLAGVEYKREPDPFLRYRKEEKLVKIVQKLFPKFGYIVEKFSIGPSAPQGPDLILKNRRKELVPVEVKAYHKYTKLGVDEDPGFYRNELLQLRAYIQGLAAPSGYLVTSTDRKTLRPKPSNVRLVLAVI